MIGSGTKSTTRHETDVLESLDFDFEQPCERKDCGGSNPAMFMLERILKHDHAVATYFCCLPCWEGLGSSDIICCSVCREIMASGPGARDKALKIIRVIGT